MSLILFLYIHNSMYRMWALNSHFIHHVFYLHRCMCNCSFRTLLNPQMSLQLLSIPKGNFFFLRSSHVRFFVVLFCVCFIFILSIVKNFPSIGKKEKLSYTKDGFENYIKKVLKKRTIELSVQSLNVLHAGGPRTIITQDLKLLSPISMIELICWSKVKTVTIHSGQKEKINQVNA